MLTAGRLVAAIYFAGFAFMLTSVVIPMLPGQTGLGHFTNINCLVGLAAGWFVMGPRAKGTLRNATGAGFTAAIAGFVAALFIHAGVEMVKLALRKRYDGGVEAIIGVIQEAWKFLIIVASMEVFLMILIGGAIGGLIARSAAMRWN